MRHVELPPRFLCILPGRIRSSLGRFTGTRSEHVFTRWDLSSRVRHTFTETGEAWSAARFANMQKHGDVPLDGDATDCRWNIDTNTPVPVAVTFPDFQHRSGIYWRRSGGVSVLVCDQPLAGSRIFSSFLMTGVRYMALLTFYVILHTGYTTHMALGALAGRAVMRLSASLELQYVLVPASVTLGTKHLDPVADALRALLIALRDFPASLKL